MRRGGSEMRLECERERGLVALSLKNTGWQEGNYCLELFLQIQHVLRCVVSINAGCMVSSRSLPGASHADQDTERYLPIHSNILISCSIIDD